MVGIERFDGGGSKLSMVGMDRLDGRDGLGRWSASTASMVGYQNLRLPR
jgi:hypothetical protein